MVACFLNLTILSYQIKQSELESIFINTLCFLQSSINSFLKFLFICRFLFCMHIYLRHNLSFILTKQASVFTFYLQLCSFPCDSTKLQKREIFNKPPLNLLGIIVFFICLIWQIWNYLLLIHSYFPFQLCFVRFHLELNW